MGMPTIPINDLDLYYETAGEGPPLLLIAGFASDSQSWAPVIPRLSEHYRLIMPDNRAVGRTAPQDASTSIEQMSEDCLALIDALQLKQVPVLGHSMGGIVAMHMAAHWSHRVQQLVLAASSPSRSARTVSLIDTLVALREAGTPDPLWFKTLFHWLLAPPFFEDPAAVDTAVKLAVSYPYLQPVAAMRRQADAIARFEADGLTTRVKTPTLAILGECDLLIPSSDAVSALCTIGDIRFEEMRDAAHSLHWDDPRTFCDIVLDFLKLD